ncbi:MAG: alginate O-acetyltransferase AlgF [Tabrizicola sp.]|uniref:alginate O-acetyltransferase AlgF n=1 Tax=Tabrizicola sp. TaxID=2005166 RepID=UPI002ABB575E|nr:alginate O-acetyltransferase AlgF [Tabrizicola sp.]MDZ4086251.1 alginate O-acetyltransferase AlgF [Tabrizicola sp.]
MKRIHLTLPLLVATASMAFAQDASLYEDVANPNSSFVRVVDASASVAVIQSASFDRVEKGVTPYVVIDGATEVSITSGETTATEAIQPATFYSFVVGADGASALVVDKITRNPAQADVTFYNLSDIALADLYVPQANAIAIEGVAPSTGGAVALKAPLTLDFEIRDGETVVATVPAVDLKRREGVAIVLSGTGGSYTATVTPNALAKQP